MVKIAQTALVPTRHAAARPHWRLAWGSGSERVLPKRKRMRDPGPGHPSMEARKMLAAVSRPMPTASWSVMRIYPSGCLDTRCLAIRPREVSCPLEKRPRFNLDRPGEQVSGSIPQNFCRWIINRRPLTEGQDVCSFVMAYRSLQEVLAGLTPASMRRLSQPVIIHAPA